MINNKNERGEAAGGGGEGERKGREKGGKDGGERGGERHTERMTPSCHRQKPDTGHHLNLDRNYSILSVRRWF